jgi:hypothetical protein
MMPKEESKNWKKRMKEISLHRGDLEAILKFSKKYPDTEYISITSEDSSGIGPIINASIKTIINGDDVIVTKSIVNESSW